MSSLIAQKEIPLGTPLQGIGPLGLEGIDPSKAPGIFNQFISGAIGLMTIVAGIWFIFLFLAGAIGIITSGGDKAALEAARKRITSGITGLFVIVAAIFIIELIGKQILGIDLILNPAEFVEKFSPGPQ